MQCRLHGRIARGKERIRIRIVDVSEGGLCLLSPLWLDPKRPVAIAIEVPNRGVSTVHVEIWHIRREKSKTSHNKIWVAGAVLRDADEAYGKLLEAVGLVAKQPQAAAPAREIKAPAPTAPAEATATISADEAIDAAELRVFRLRCKARGSPRSRVLTLAAEDADEVMKLAEIELGGAWDILEVREA